MYSAARLGSLVNDISSQVLKAIELSLLQLHRHLCRRCHQFLYSYWVVCWLFKGRIRLTKY